MTPIGAAAAAVPAAPTDPRELALHLEICRLQAELEGLEARIHQVEAARAAGGSGYDPFVERAEELVERMVASLYVTGRAEIAEAAAASDTEAEAVIAEARARAQAILNEARGELATVLVDRADAVDELVVPDSVLDLTEAAPPVVAEALVVADDEVAAEPVPVAAVEPVVAEPEAVEIPELPGPVTAAATVVEPVVESEPEVLVERVVAEPEVAAAPAAFVLPDVEAPDLQDAAPGLASTAPAGGAAASDRTDAAFEAWLAVAPTPPADPADAATDTAVGTDDELVPESVRPAWVRPLEAAIALVAVAVLVILALLLVG